MPRFALPLSLAAWFAVFAGSASAARPEITTAKVIAPSSVKGKYVSKERGFCTAKLPITFSVRTTGLVDKVRVAAPSRKFNIFLKRSGSNEWKATTRALRYCVRKRGARSEIAHVFFVLLQYRDADGFVRLTHSGSFGTRYVTIT